MSAVLSGSSAWNAKRWWLTTLAACLGQVAILFFLSPGGETSRPAPLLKTRVHLVAPALKPSPGAELAGPVDPTLFALPNARGFSGSAWLTIPRFQYEMTNSLPPPSWLAAPIDELADDYDSFVQTNLRGDESVSAKLDPVLSQVDVPSPILTAAARVRITGDLSSSRMRADEPLAVPSHPILSHTLIRVRVDLSGRTLSAALLASCGVPSVDQQALRFAKQAEYETRPFSATDPGSNPSVIFGELTFQWHQYRWTNTGTTEGKP